MAAAEVIGADLAAAAISAAAAQAETGKLFQISDFRFQIGGTLLIWNLKSEI